MGSSSPATSRFGFGTKTYSNLEAVSPKPDEPFYQEARTPYPQVIHPRSTPFLHIVEPDYSSRGWDNSSATLFGTPPGSRDYIPVPEYTKYVPSSEPIPPAEQNRRMMRLSDKAFWTIVFVVGFFVAAAIGGGIGGGLVASHNRCAKDSDSRAHGNSNTDAASKDTEAASSIPPTATTGTTTATSTSAGAVGATSPAPVDDGCPNINGTTYMPTDGQGKSIPVKMSGGTAQSFVRLCRTDFPVGKEYGNGGIHDILKLYLPSLEDCIAACAFYNQRYQTKTDKGVPVAGGLCRSVTIVKKAGGHCYLKNGTANNYAKEADPDLTSSAVILAF